MFVDTSAWLAVSDRREVRHATAVETYKRLLKAPRRLVTTDLVLAEAHILLRRRVGHAAAMTFMGNVNASALVELVYADPELEVQAKDLLHRFADQDISLADAVSFAVMQRRSIELAFAFDRHFSIAGFDVVPQS